MRAFGRESVTRRTWGLGKEILVKEVEGGAVEKFEDAIEVLWELGKAACYILKLAESSTAYRAYLDEKRGEPRLDRDAAATADKP